MLDNKKRPSHSKLIGEKLIIELSKELIKGNFFTLIGPKRIGKSFLLNEIKKQLYKFEILEVIHIKPLVNKSLISQISEILNFNDTNDKIVNNGSEILDIINRYFVDNTSKRISFLIDDILDFKPDEYNGIISALASAYTKYQGKISAAISGNLDVLKYVSKPGSEYHFAKKILLEGIDFELTREVIKKNFAKNKINNKAIEYLYEQTNGCTFLMHDILLSKNLLHSEEILENFKLNSTISNAKELLIHYQNKEIEFNSAVQLILNNLEKRPLDFKSLIAVLGKNDFELTFADLLDNDKHEFDSYDALSIPYLSATGLVYSTFDDKLYISSPLLKKYLKKRYTFAQIGKVFAINYCWQDAFNAFHKCNSNEKFNNILSNDLELDRILQGWTNTVYENINHEDYLSKITSLFIEGAKDLLLFDEGKIDYYHGMDKKSFLNGKASFGNPELPLDEIDKIEKQKLVDGFLFGNNLELVKILPAAPPEIPSSLIIYLKRQNENFSISSFEFNIQKRVLSNLCTALNIAIQKSYKERLGSIKDLHTNILTEVNRRLTQTPFNLDKMLDLVCRKLIEDKYYRVLICLVDPSRVKIKGTNEKCKDKKKEGLLKEGTDYKLRSSESDIQPYIVTHKKEGYVIKNGCSHKDKKINTSLTKKACVFGAGIVPLIAGNEIIGTLHFERDDKVFPGDEEMNLFKNFAYQLGMEIIKGIRLSMLRDALHAVDDIIVLSGIKNEPIFINYKASRAINFLNSKNNMKPGWQNQVDTQYILDPESNKNKYHRRLYNLRNLKTIQEELWVPYKKEYISAATWTGSPLKNDWDEIIGTVESVHSISWMDNLLKTISRASKESVPKKVIRQFLNGLLIQGFERARFYHLCENKLKSYVAVGFQNAVRLEEFEKGNCILNINMNSESCICIKEEEPVILIHDPAVSELTLCDESNHTFKTYKYPEMIYYKEVEAKNGDIRIDLPVISGEECIGKISINPSKDKISPKMNHYLKVFKESASVVIDAAFKQDYSKMIERNLILAKMFSHRMGSKIRQSISLCNDLINSSENLSSQQVEKKARSLKGLFISTNILTEFLLGTRQGFDETFERFNIIELLYEVKEAFEFEIAEWKNIQPDLKDWNCLINIRHEMSNIDIYANRIYIWNAIDNIIANSIDALRKLYLNGNIYIYVGISNNSIVIQISSDGPKVQPTMHLEFIKKVIAHNGDLDSLIEIDPPLENEESVGVHRKLGIKISTFIIKSIHKGEIRLISSDNESPKFEIIIPNNLKKDAKFRR